MSSAIFRLCFQAILSAALLGLSACAVVAPLSPPQACKAALPVRGGWLNSFTAGCIDENGHFIGGSQLIHLVPHQGRLYGALGYWKDSRNIWYGGRDASNGWAQVLRLDDERGAWKVDLDMGAHHLRAELLKSVTFTQDANGRALESPQTLLIAATYDGPGTGGVSVFVRDDATGSWVRTKLISASTGVRGEDNSVRAAVVYRDRVTGEESLFVSVGVLGLYRGRYDPAAPGRIRWDPKPEAGAGLYTRILSVVEAQGSLYVSEGAKILRRIDGPSPRYEQVVDLSSEIDTGTSRKVFQSIGGIRGLSALPGSTPGQESLIFVWHSGRHSAACVMRLDPGPQGSHQLVREECLSRAVSQHLGGLPIGFVLAAYNNFMPVRDPRSGQWAHVVGLEAFIPKSGSVQAAQHLLAENQRNAQGGFYAGAMYALRNAQGRWSVGEVMGRHTPGDPSLVSIYTFASSPFSIGDRPRIYLGGYDANDYPSTNTAWIYSADLEALFGAPP